MPALFIVKYVGYIFETEPDVLGGEDTLEGVGALLHQEGSGRVRALHLPDRAGFLGVLVLLPVDFGWQLIGEQHRRHRQALHRLEVLALAHQRPDRVMREKPRQGEDQDELHYLPDVGIHRSAFAQGPPILLPRAEPRRKGVGRA